MGAVVSRLTRPLRNFNVERRAEKVITKHAEGVTPVRAPLYESEKRRVQNEEANESLKHIHEKHPELVKRVSDIRVHASEVKTSEKGIEGKHYPTRDTEAATAGVVWEYRFYEPPPEKIRPGKLTFRDALLLMSADVKYKHDPTDAASEDILKNHPATKRVPKESIDLMLKYFGPFEYIGMQSLVRQTQRIAYEAKLVEDELKALNAADQGMSVEEMEDFEKLSVSEKMQRRLARLREQQEELNRKNSGDDSTRRLLERVVQLEEISSELQSIAERQEKAEERRKLLAKENEKQQEADKRQQNA